MASARVGNDDKGRMLCGLKCGIEEVVY
jgi:hypothetical protein